MREIALNCSESGYSGQQVAATAKEKEYSWAQLQNPALMQGLAHPMRARMLHVLHQRQASPKELATEFNIPLANVAYHIQVLRKLKLIKLVKRTPRRGAVEHHYKANHGAFVDDDVWGDLPGIVKDAATASLLENVGEIVGGAAATGGFNRADSHFTASHLTLDQQGWDELAAMLKDVLERGQGLKQESDERLRAANHEGETRAGLVMMLFEASPQVPEPDEISQAGPAPADPHARPRDAELAE
jgi:DNA-binding transcriptional ArsR family regulator